MTLYDPSARSEKLEGLVDWPGLPHRYSTRYGVIRPALPPFDSQSVIVVHSHQRLPIPRSTTAGIISSFTHHGEIESCGRQTLC